jgi:transcriptional regulator
LLSRLVARHEAGSSYRLEGPPQDFVEKEMKGVAGFALDVTHIEAAYKLSQNRNDEDHASVVHELEKRDDGYSREIAQAMSSCRKKDAG